jgi:hypothetical protein
MWNFNRIKNFHYRQFIFIDRKYTLHYTHLLYRISHISLWSLYYHYLKVLFFWLLIQFSSQFYWRSNFTQNFSSNGFSYIHWLYRDFCILSIVIKIWPNFQMWYKVRGFFLDLEFLTNQLYCSCTMRMFWLFLKFNSKVYPRNVS